MTKSMTALRSRSFATGMLVLLIACSQDDAPEKPARLHAPPVTADLVATRGERQTEYYARQVMLIKKWINQSGIPPHMAAGLLDVVSQSRDEKGVGRNLNAGDMITDLQTWFTAAGSGDAKRRAAAYLVGDEVLRLAWRPFLLTDPNQQQDLRDTLKTMGAETFFSQAAGEVEYTGSWLHAAVEADPKGPMGQRAALLLIEGECAGGNSTAAYHTIVARLDSLLVSPADSEVRFAALVLQADAYRDIVVLSHGGGGANADSTKFAPEAADARAKALTLYQAALAIDTTSRFSHGAQLSRERLASGQPLEHMRFFCFAE
jgi:hypothetical protein